MTIQRTAFRFGAAAIAACALTAGLPAAAQSANSRGEQAAGTRNPAGKSDPAGKPSKADQRMMRDIAQANIAEIETGKLAQEKASKDEVKQFGKTMVDDHTKALGELQEIASKKSVELPTEPDVKHKATATALKALNGDAFDKQYMSMAGVSDHQKTHDMLQKVQRNAADPDLKAYAAKTLPVVHGHLTTAQEVAGKKSK
jgi:putative membrane protein